MRNSTLIMASQMVFEINEFELIQDYSFLKSILAKPWLFIE